MPILDLQRRLRKLGDIRLGDRSGPRNAPTTLETFRLTSASQVLINQAAVLYGGEPKDWESPRGPEWQVITEADSINVVLPPEGHMSQWMEMWQAGGCQRRCDTRIEQIEQVECLCPADKAERSEQAKKGEACLPVTRLSLLLPGIEGLGIWRLVTSSWFAAVELAGVADILAEASAQKRSIPAVLRIEPRKSKNAEGQAMRYSVPVLDAQFDALALGASTNAVPPALPASSAGQPVIADPTTGEILKPATGAAAAAQSQPDSADAGLSRARRERLEAEFKALPLTAEAFNGRAAYMTRRGFVPEEAQLLKQIGISRGLLFDDSGDVRRFVEVDQGAASEPAPEPEAPSGAEPEPEAPPTASEEPAPDEAAAGPFDF